MATGPGTFREVDGEAVEMADAKEAWTPFARAALVRTAGKYRATITYKELGTEVQELSGIRTRMLLQHWIGDLLGLVSDECRSAGEPLLSSLCVTSDGTVGPGYAKVISWVETEGGKDVDDLAAEERLRCYEHFGATLPADGGRPSLHPTLARKREREMKAKIAARPRAVCPTCHMQVPTSGICDTCD